MKGHILVKGNSTLSEVSNWLRKWAQAFNTILEENMNISSFAMLKRISKSFETLSSRGIVIAKVTFCDASNQDMVGILNK